MTIVPRVPFLVAVVALAAAFPSLFAAPGYATTAPQGGVGSAAPLLTASVSEKLRLAYSCTGTSCTCTGDDDCNGMFTHACGPTGGLCEGTRCSCPAKALMGTSPNIGNRGTAAGTVEGARLPSGMQLSGAGHQRAHVA